MNVFVCLPCYNEAENLPDLVSSIDKQLRCLMKMNYEILAVDDGSTDDTLKVLEQLTKKYPLIMLIHTQNMGLTEAYRTLLEVVKRMSKKDDVIIFMDADGTHEPYYFGAMLTAMKQGANIAVASRYRGDQIGVAFHRRVLSKGVNWLIRNLTHLPVQDCTCGYRCFEARVIKELPELRSDGFEVSAELLIKASRLNPKPNIVEIPFILRYDQKKGKSKLHIRETVKAYLKLLWNETQMDLTPFLSEVAHKIHPKLGSLYEKETVFWNDGMLALVFLVVSFFIYDSFTQFLPQILRLTSYVGIAFVSFCIQHVLRRFWVFK